jgi:N-acetyltransferase 10
LTPYISQFDLKRLESYSKNMVDFHLIMDLVPTIARLYFYLLPPGVYNLSPVQAALLTGIGLQFKSVDDLQGDLNLPAN